MAEFLIADEDLVGMKGKVVVVTGGSSGIGLATVQLLLSLGASVVAADLREPPGRTIDNSEHFLFHPADVTEWADLVAMFKAARAAYGAVDHVFANAGIGGGKADYVDLQLDADGEPAEPTSITLDVNLKATLNTAALVIHYIRQQDPGRGGSVVLCGSVMGYIPVRMVDYAVSKHGVIGAMRSLHRALNARGLVNRTASPSSAGIRVNAVAPYWTSPTAMEIDVTVVVPAYRAVVRADTLDEDEAYGRVLAEVEKRREAGVQVGT
ncbi:putative 15-hydroxyprostaglandin dehydrogenase [Xylariaceae sp. FL0804]|nr:putative 15-hydroxyprostaglandin dehydrogenase [Xylariaceae sp. FL0804]